MHWTDRQTDRPTDRLTDRSEESLTTTGRCATTAMQPNNNNRPQMIKYDWEMVKSSDSAGFGESTHWQN